MISYFELLKMIKENDIPNKIRVKLTPGSSRVYVREDDTDDTFSHYYLENVDEDNEIYKYYLSECYLESTMFDKTIEIIEEEMCHKCHKYPAEHNQTYCEFCLGISKEEKKIEPIIYSVDNAIYYTYINGNYKEDKDLNKMNRLKINEIIDQINEMNNK